MELEDRPEGDLEWGFVKNKGNCSLYLSKSIKFLTMPFLVDQPFAYSSAHLTQQIFTEHLNHSLELFQSLGIENGIKQTKTYIPKTFI